MTFQIRAQTDRNFEISVFSLIISHNDNCFLSSFFPKYRKKETRKKENKWLKSLTDLQKYPWFILQMAVNKCMSSGFYSFVRLFVFFYCCFFIYSSTILSVPLSVHSFIRSKYIMPVNQKVLHGERLALIVYMSFGGVLGWLGGVLWFREWHVAM